MRFLCWCGYTKLSCNHQHPLHVIRHFPKYYSCSICPFKKSSSVHGFYFSLSNVGDNLVTDKYEKVQASTRVTATPSTSYISSGKPLLPREPLRRIQPRRSTAFGVHHLPGARYLEFTSFSLRKTFSNETVRNLPLRSASSRAKGGPSTRVIRSRASSR